jgi:ubiquinol-cytochrome c reductase cytochrome c1 subunit
MNKIKSILGALAIGVVAFATPVMAQEHATPAIEKEPWTFAGLFGTYDRDQLQRGFQVFKDVCASCHAAHLLAFRNLSEPGGPEYTEDQVKALAASYQITDAEAAGGKRPGIAADRWPSPFANDQEARDANGGALPPDMSVLAKARGVSTPFPFWIWNYVSGYSEGGPDYIHALLNGYEEQVPEGTVGSDGKPFVLPEGKYFNHYFPGYAIGMPPPLSDGGVTYDTPEEGVPPVPQTVEQYSRDVSAFLMWVAEPHLIARKEAGMQVLVFLIVFAGLMYMVKRRLWSKVEH